MSFETVLSDVKALDREDRALVIVELLAKDGLNEKSFKAFLNWAKKLPSKGRAALAGKILNMSNGLPDSQLYAFAKELSVKNASYLNAFAQCRGF